MLVQLLTDLTLVVLGMFAAGCLGMAWRLISGVEEWPPPRPDRVMIKDGRWVGIPATGSLRRPGPE